RALYLTETILQPGTRALRGGVTLMGLAKLADLLVQVLLFLFRLRQRITTFKHRANPGDLTTALAKLAALLRRHRLGCEAGLEVLLGQLVQLGREFLFRLSLQRIKSHVRSPSA